MRKIRKKIVHCSDSDVKSHDDISVIRKWHIEERGWRDVGYHFFIQSNGNVQKGRPIEKIGAHCLHQNADSIGICMHGKSGNFTEDQLLTLKLLIEEIDEVFGWTPNYNHSDFDVMKPFCSGLDLIKEGLS